MLRFQVPSSEFQGAGSGFLVRVSSRLVVLEIRTVVKSSGGLLLPVTLLRRLVPTRQKHCF